MSEGRNPGPNELGPIARSYAQLQSLPTLFAALRRPPIPPAGSAWQAVDSLFQAIEIALVNLEALACAASRHAEATDGLGAYQTIGWMVAFGKAWVDLSWRILDVAPLATSRDGHMLDVASSPNWAALRSAEEQLASALAPTLTDSIANEWASGDRNSPELARVLLRYVMLERIGLEYSAVAGAPSDYTAMVRPAPIRAAVLERTLRGETVFMQFRAAHQMPEVLIDAANDHLELSIAHIRRDEFEAAAEILRRADRLLDATVSLTDILVDRLVTDDYHQIRENLGLTSGSHSVGIHFHLMRDLYPALVSCTSQAIRNGRNVPAFSLVRTLVRSIGRHVDRWRLAHLNLPRTNLGGAGTGTRSLTGSLDALQTAGRMREVAQFRDPLNALGGQPFRAIDWESSDLPLAAIERRLLAAIAQRTQTRFPDVQGRTGRFAAAPDFTSPPTRGPSRSAVDDGRTHG